MESLASSKIKTEHSFVDYISANDASTSIDYANKVEQTTKIVNWTQRMMSNGVHFHKDFSQTQNPANNFFLIKIDSFHNLGFRRVNQKSKTFALITAILINTKTGKQYFKTTKTFKQLQEHNAYLFDLKESIYYYCYTPNEADLLLQIQISISEQLHSAQQKQQKELIYMNLECVGFLALELSKERKNKQKCELILPGVVNRFNKESAEKNSAYAYVFVVKTEAFKHLEKLVLCNTICDSTDRIPGLLGYYLPNNQNSLSDFSLTAEAKGLVINAQQISINQSLFKDSYTKCQKMMSHKYKDSKRIQCFCNELLLKASFHNSWRSVSDGQIRLKEKQGLEGVLRARESTISGMQINKSKESLSLSKQKQKKDAIKTQYKHFSAQKPLELGLVFPDQDECVLILQIYAHFTVNIEYDEPNSKPPVHQFKEQLNMPLCFSLLSAKSINKLRFQTLNLNEGCPLTSIQHLKTMINNEIKKLQQPNTQTQAKRFSKQSAIKIDAQNVSVIKSVKTLSNITYKSLKDPLVEYGAIQFEIQLIEKQPGAIISNRSLGIENISGLNLSRMQVKDKINAEKERITKQAKKTVSQAKKMQIQFYKAPKVPENMKFQVTAPFMKQPTSKQSYQKQNLLNLLKKSIPIPPNQSQKTAKSNQIYKQEQNLKANHSNSVYYKLNLAHTLQSVNYQPTKLPAEFYYLHSNYHYNYNLSCYLYEKTPIQLIKTQLAEIMYNNCFFFNFDHITSTSAESATKLPHTFFLKTQFWNQPPIRSQLLTVNKDTGQISLFGFDDMPEPLKKQISKIMHIQIAFDETIDNYQMNFIHFIDYLYNGLLKIEVIDYSNAHLYGHFYAPLRNLIRKRRNEAISVHQDFVYHRNIKKGKVRLEMRAIRKIRHLSKRQSMIKETKSPKIQLDNSKMQLAQLVKAGNNRVDQQKQLDQKRQKQRIMKFKQAKSKVVQNRIAPKQSQTNQTQQQLRQLRHIQNIVIDNYMVEQKAIKVNFLNRHYFFINISNKNPRNMLYQFVINDQDAENIMKNTLSGGEELIVVKNISLLEQEDIQKLSAIKKNIPLIPKCKNLNEQGLILMQPNEKATLLLCYLSVRKHKDWTETHQTAELLSIYNRERIITCSLVDSPLGAVQALYSIQVIPVSDQSNVQLQFYRPHNQKTSLHLPFLDSQFISDNIDQIMIDDPYILVASAGHLQNLTADRKIGGQGGLILELSNDVSNQKSKVVNLLVINDVAQKMGSLPQTNLKDKSRIRAQNEVRFLQNHHFGPSTLSISLNICGCLKIQAVCQLWQQAQTIYELQSRLFQHVMKTNYFYILSDEEQTLKISRNRKNKGENHQLFKRTKQNEKIKIFFTIFASKTGLNYINLHAIQAQQILEQQSALKDHTFKEVQPLYKMVFCLNVRVPAFKEVLRINISRSSQQKIIEQPFNYRSTASKKSQFRVLSSQPHLLWVKQSDSVFQLQSKAERKLSLYFNIEQLLKSNESMGVAQHVVIGVKWDKGLDYFSFRFIIN